MSTISSVGSSPADLSTVLQQLQDGQTNAASTGAANDPDSLLATSANDSTKGVPEQGHHHHGGSEKIKQIQSAVTSALQGAPAGSDPNTVIQNAIAQALQQNGASGANSASGGASAQDTSSSASSQGQSPQEFQSVLSSYGVTAQEFGADFQAAVKQSGVNFPPGAFTDVAA